MNRLQRSAAVALALLLNAPSASAQVMRSIDGRLLEADGSPASAVDIEVAREGGSQAVRTRSDRSGAWVVVLPAGASGRYLVRVFSLRHKPRALLVTVAERSITIDTIVLEPRPAVQMQGLTVTAEMPVPSIQRAPELERTADEEWTQRGNAALPAHLRGSLSEMAATVPGIGVVGGGVSAYGLPPEASGVTLNGLAVGGLDLPRNLRSTVRVSRSTYDPSRGGFAAVQTGLTIGPSYGFVTRRANATSALNAATTAEEGGTTFKTETGFEGGSFNGLTYSGAVSLSRSASEQPGLGLRSVGELREAGLTRNTLDRLEATLQRAGIQSGLMRELPSRDQRATIVFRTDRRPYNPGTWSILTFAQLDESESAPQTASALAEWSRRRTSMLGGQFSGTTVLHQRFLTDVTLGFTRETRNDPGASGHSGVVYLADPDILVGPQHSVRFGSPGNPASRTSEWSAEGVIDSRWHPARRDHLLKVYLNGSVRARTARDQSNDGVYTFPSLEALDAGDPVAFNGRAVNTESSIGHAGLALAFSDTWNPSGRLQVLSGIRVEGGRLWGLREASETARSLGATEPSWNNLDISPRFGFSWAYGQRARADGSRSRSPAAGIIRGGVGHFRAAVPLSTLAEGALRGSAIEVRCIGPSIREPRWLGGAAADGCEGGNDGVVQAPGDRELGAYSPLESWRGSLAWATRIGTVNTSIEGAYSFGMNHPRWRDLNFDGDVRFSLDSEGGRPVFSRPEEIEAASGGTLGLGQRIVPERGSVAELRSDLRSRSREITVRLVPDLAGRNRVVMAYTYSIARQQFDGSSGGAFGDVRAVEWAPSPYTAEHQVMVMGTYRVRKFGHLSLFGSLRSGLPFTPIVAGDPNGDGNPGDRAFVFADPTDSLGAATIAMLPALPSFARSCLEDRSGQDIGRNSCRGRWSRRVNIGYSTARDALGNGRRVNIDVQLVNVLAGLERIITGAARGGWDGTAGLDPVLYSVTGFDAAAGEYRYRLNTNFARSNPGQAGLPFQVVLDFSFDWGPSLERQTLRRAMAPEPGETTRPNADAIRERLGFIGRNFYPAVLQLSDDLMLDAEQFADLERAEAEYDREIEALRAEFAAYLASQPVEYDTRVVMTKQREVDRAGLQVVKAHALGLRDLLTPFQLGLLPPNIRDLMTIEI